MATPRIQLQLYRTTGTGPPEALQPGELAFSEGDKGLHIGLSDGSIYTIPLVTLAQLLASDREWSTIVNRPSTLAGYGVALQLSDIPNGIDYQTLHNRPDISALDELLDYPDLASFPATGDSQKLYIALDTGLFYRWAAGTYHQLTGRAAEWGEVVGSLDNQGDLKARLDALWTAIPTVPPLPKYTPVVPRVKELDNQAVSTAGQTLQLTGVPSDRPVIAVLQIDPGLAAANGDLSIVCEPLIGGTQSVPTAGSNGVADAISTFYGSFPAYERQRPTVLVPCTAGQVYLARAGTYYAGLLTSVWSVGYWENVTIGS